MKKALKIISINIIVLFAIIILLDLFSFIAINTSQLISDNFSKPKEKIDFRANFPVYKNKAQASIFYKELYKIKLEYRSYFEWRALAFNGYAINIDSNGIRSTIDYHPAVPKNKSISFFGGSTIWGFGVNDSSTIPSLFSKNSNGEYTITNYGEQGYRAFQSLQLMQIYFINKNLSDIVVFYDGANNYRALNERSFSSNRENSIIERLKGMDQDLNGINNSNVEATKLSKHYLYPTRYFLSKIVNKFKKNNNSDITNFRLKHNEITDSLAATELLETWLLAKIFTESKGKQFYCVLQPTFFSSNAILSNYIKEGINNGIYNEKTYKYYNLVKNYMKKDKYTTLNKNFIDLSSTFYKKDNIYIDFCHLAYEGNETIANDLIQRLTIKNN
jgi:hypothetical protein